MHAYSLPPAGEKRPTQVLRLISAVRDSPQFIGQENRYSSASHVQWIIILPGDSKEENADDLFGFVALGVGGIGACRASICKRKENSTAKSEAWAMI
jgi:hypothetical protein